MTPSQVFTIAAIGGLAAIFGLVLAVLIAVGIFALVSRIYDAHEARRERRQVLADYRRQLDELPTTNHPKESRP